MAIKIGGDEVITNNKDVKVNTVYLGAGSGSGNFQASSSGHTTFKGGDFSFESSVENWHNYAADQYLGYTDGLSRIMIRGVIKGLTSSSPYVSNWSINDAGDISATTGDFSGALNVGDNVTIGGDLAVTQALDLGINYPCFHAVLNSDHTWTSSWAQIKFTSESWTKGGFDVGGDHDTSLGIFTAPVTGIYKFDLQVTTFGMDEDAGACGARFLQHGSKDLAHTHMWDTNEMMAIGMHSSGGNYYSEAHSLAFGTMMELVAGDTVMVQVYSSNIGDGDARLRGIESNDGETNRLSWWEGRLITTNGN